MFPYDFSVVAHIDTWLSEYDELPANGDIIDVKCPKGLLIPTYIPPVLPRTTPVPVFGDTGATGPRGLEGERGPQGATGPQEGHWSSRSCWRQMELQALQVYLVQKELLGLQDLLEPLELKESKENEVKRVNQDPLVQWFECQEMIHFQQK